MLLIKIKDGKIDQIDKKLVVDDDTKTSTQERLFDFIADCLKNFITEQKLTTKLPLGFTFSFPVKQTSLISGTLIRWTKDFDADGTVGEDVVLLLRDAVKRQRERNQGKVSMREANQQEKTERKDVREHWMLVRLLSPTGN